MDLHHKILKDLNELNLWIYKISKDFMNFKKRGEGGGGEERRKREGGGRERDSKILKEKQSQEISCFHERLFVAKIS